MALLIGVKTSYAAAGAGLLTLLFALFMACPACPIIGGISMNLSPIQNNLIPGFSSYLYIAS
jgi:uncharacterized membrane protein YphA (DoxX/SURF4 family)